MSARDTITAKLTSKFAPVFLDVIDVAQHRAVMDVLEAELKDRVHALAIEVLPPDGPWELPDRV
jgi:BolA protein